MLASSIVSFLGGLGDFSLQDLAKHNLYGKAIHEFGYVGPFTRILRDCSGYSNSYFGPEPPKGGPDRFEDLSRTTFPENALDAVLTVEVLEHVFNLEAVLAEVHRILKPNGLHFFSTPVDFPLKPKTVSRSVLSQDGSVSHILNPHFHVAADGGKSLVTYDFGQDLRDIHEQAGFLLFSFKVDGSSVPNRNISFVAMKRGGDFI